MMRRPSVMHVITSTGVGGAERALERLVLGLAHRYDFEVLSLKPLGPVGRRLQGAGIRVDSLMSRGWNLPGVLLRLSKRIESRKPDLTHAWLFQANLLTRFAAGFQGVANISSIRTLEKEKTWQPWLDGVTYSWVNRYLAVSEAAARFTTERGVPASRIRVIPNGLADDEFLEPPGWQEFRPTQRVPEDAFLMICAGRLRMEKGHRYALRLLAHLVEAERPSDPPAWLVLAGEGPERGRLERLARDLGVADRVRMPGVLSDLRPAWRAANLHLLPSLWEGMPNVVLEAAAQALPTIGFETGGTGEVVREGVTGFLCPSRRVDLMAVRARHLRDHPDLAGDMGRAARAWVQEQFSIRRTLQATAEVYEELLAQS